MSPSENFGRSIMAISAHAQQKIGFKIPEIVVQLPKFGNWITISLIF